MPNPFFGRSFKALGFKMHNLSKSSEHHCFELFDFYNSLWYFSAKADYICYE